MFNGKDLEGASGRFKGLTIAVLVAVPTAILCVVGAVAFVVLVEAPGSGLAGETWRVLFVDDGAWLTVVLASVAVTYAVRPIPPGEMTRWLARRDLPRTVTTEAGKELRRTRIFRTLPAVLGACIGPGAGHAYNLALRYQPADTPVTDALLGAASGPGAYSSFGLVIGGYLGGGVVAEFTRRRPAPREGRGARLHIRRPESYLTPTARVLPAGVAVLVAAFAGVASLVGGTADPRTPTLTTVTVAVLLLVAGVPAVQWFVVRRPQSHDEPVTLALDDTFRSSAAHAVVGASTAAALGVLSGLMTGIWNALLERGSTVVWLLVPLGVAVVAATFAAWMHYGSSHPGVRPVAGRR